MKIEDAGIGTFTDIATVPQTATVYDALSVFVDRRVSALPVVDENGTLHLKNSENLCLVCTLYRHTRSCLVMLCLFTTHFLEIDSNVSLIVFYFR